MVFGLGTMPEGLVKFTAAVFQDTSLKMHIIIILYCMCFKFHMLNVRILCTSAAICKSFVCENLDISGYVQNNGQQPQI